MTDRSAVSAGSAPARDAAPSSPITLSLFRMKAFLLNLIVFVLIIMIPSRKAPVHADYINTDYNVDTDKSIIIITIITIKL